MKSEISYSRGVGIRGVGVSVRLGQLEGGLRW